MEYYQIGNVSISATSPKDVVEGIKSLLSKGSTEYVCVSNVRTVKLANKDPHYHAIMESAYMCIPDGMPLVWMARLWGLKDVHRTTGPDLFMALLKSHDSRYRHFFLGDTQETLDAMKKKYADCNIVGCYSPPFMPLEQYDIQGIADMVNRSGANILWLSMRAPKQDELATMLKSHLNHTVIIGVGAAFRFALGQYKHPNPIIQKLGLTGLFWRKGKVKVFVILLGRMVLILWWGIQILYRRIIRKR